MDPMKSWINRSWFEVDPKLKNSSNEHQAASSQKEEIKVQSPLSL